MKVMHISDTKYEIVHASVYGLLSELQVHITVNRCLLLIECLLLTHVPTTKISEVSPLQSIKSQCLEGSSQQV